MIIETKYNIGDSVRIIPSEGDVVRRGRRWIQRHPYRMKIDAITYNGETVFYELKLDTPQRGEHLNVRETDIELCGNLLTVDKNEIYGKKCSLLDCESPVTLSEAMPTEYVQYEVGTPIEITSSYRTENVVYGGVQPRVYTVVSDHNGPCCQG